MASATQKEQDKKKFEPPERIKPKTLVVAALTAVTMAVLSTRLTSVMNSITLVALASLLTAFISETYRVLLEYFHKSVRSNVDKLINRGQIEMDTSTGEFHIVDAEITKPEEPKEERGYTYTPIILPLGKRIVRLIRRALNSRYGTALWFALIGATTIMATLAFGGDNGGETYEFKPSIVQTKNISKGKQDEIKKAASTDAQKKAETAQLNAEKHADDLNTATKTELIALIEALQTELDGYETTNGEQAEQIASLVEQIETLTTTIETLTADVTTLQENNSETPTQQNNASTE